MKTPLAALFALTAASPAHASPALATASAETRAAVHAARAGARAAADGAIALLAGELRGHELELSSLRAELRGLTAAAASPDEQDRFAIERFPRYLDSYARSLTERVGELRRVSTTFGCDARGAAAARESARRLHEGTVLLSMEAAQAADAFDAAGLKDAAGDLDRASREALSEARVLRDEADLRLRR
ncbi:MAG: hypothetical protein SF051_14020 [Elusimicrobiota bacterium]|nr:hypothetical protein [Elusimicrobiota bacterium]